MYRSLLILTTTMMICMGCTNSSSSSTDSSQFDETLTFESGLDKNKPLNSLTPEEARELQYQYEVYQREYGKSASLQHVLCLDAAFVDSHSPDCMESYDLCIEIGFPKYKFYVETDRMIEDPDSEFPASSNEPYFGFAENQYTYCDATVGRYEQCWSYIDRWYFSTYVDGNFSCNTSIDSMREYREDLLTDELLSCSRVVDCTDECNNPEFAESEFCET